LNVPEPNPFDRHRYRLVGGVGECAQRQGLVDANWYKCTVPRQVMKALTQRSDARAIRDTLLWYLLIITAGILAWLSLGTVWVVPAFALYGALYCGPADSRWHECGHGSAFKTRWLNDALYQAACFQVMRRPTVWRWSHARHHTDTLITGRDPEITAQVPPPVTTLLLNLVGVRHCISELRKMVFNALGRIDQDESTFVPQSEWPRIVREARLWMVVYAALLLVCLLTHSLLPLLFVGLPSFYGAWLYLFFGLTQHAGMPENVLDHRLNCRTVMMNPVFRFLYWNMNYHVDHHMFPMVPYYALPALHEAIKQDCPTAYASTWAAYKEILPVLFQQLRDPTYHVRRVLPAANTPSARGA
jgi:fatty acid desaturase